MSLPHFRCCVASVFKPATAETPEQTPRLHVGQFSIFTMFHGSWEEHFREPVGTQITSFGILRRRRRFVCHFWHPTNSRIRRSLMMCLVEEARLMS